MSGNNGKAKTGRPTKRAIPEGGIQRSLELYWIERIERCREVKEVLPAEEYKQLMQALDMNCFGGNQFEEEPDGTGMKLPQSQWANTA